MASEREAKGPEIKGSYDVDDHLQSIHDVAARYQTRIDAANPLKSPGLTTDEAAQRLERDGPNRLSPPKTRPEWLKFLLAFSDPLLLLLVLAAVLTFVAYGIQDPKEDSNIILGVTLFIVIFFLGLSTYLQERSASNVANSLKSLLPSGTKVMRNGGVTSVPADQLVVGDVVILGLGDRVPADVRIIQTAELKCDFSSLTGESDPIPMGVDSQHNDVTESRNVAFMTSLVQNGEGRGIVIRTGDRTMIGAIAALAGDTGGQVSTLQADVQRFVVFVAIVAVVSAITLFVVGLARGLSFADAFVSGMVVVLVANIPQGLPASVTSALNITAQRMRDANVLVKRTDIVESLGSATRIASDKTGTLTQNKMTVMNVWVNRQFKTSHDVIASVGAVAAGAQDGSMAESIARESLRSLGLPNRLTGGAQSGHDGSGMLSSPHEATIPEDAPAADGNDKMEKKHSGPAGGAAGHGSSHGGAARFRDHLSRMSRDLHMSSTEADLRGITRQSSASPQFTFGINAFDGFSSMAWTAHTPMTKLVVIATVCNRAQFQEETGSDGNVVVTLGYDGERKVQGDATDSGLLRFVDRLVPVHTVRRAYNKRMEIPFNSKNKWMFSLCDIPDDHTHNIIFMKGAPEIIIKHCTRYMYRNKEHEMTSEFAEDMIEAYDSFGLQAERVIGFAYKVVPSQSPPADQEDAEKRGLTEGLTFCGLLSLIDPPRETVPPAVAACRRAGIRVTMVTGDHPITAEAISRKVGIISLPTRREIASEMGVAESQIAVGDERVGAVVVTGAMINELSSEADWDEIMAKPEIVFARTTPQHKLMIVQNFQRLGEIVALTGDGVNDAPALRKAHIGVAMGSPDSSDVAREAADIVLLDDNFASLVAAIAEGRVLYDNLKKTIAYTLSHIPPETAPVLLLLAFGMPLGLTSLCVLSIDLITEQGPAISLAYEPAEANVMARPPRNMKVDRLVSGPLIRYCYLIVGLAEAVICLLAYFTAFWYNDIPTSKLWLADNNGDDGAIFVLSNPEDSDNPPFCVDPSEDPIDANGMLICPGGGELIDRDDQERIAREANTAWYINLILCQFWHIWVSKTRYVSIFKHNIFDNPITIYGTAVSLAVAAVVAYIPWLQDNVFFTANPPGFCYLPHLGFLVFILAFTEYNKRQYRRNPLGFWARYMTW